MARPLRAAPIVEPPHQVEDGMMSEADVDMSDMGAIMAALKIGTTMTKLPSKAKGKAEPKTFQLNLDEFKITWYRGAGNKEEGSSEFGCGVDLEKSVGGRCPMRALINAISNIYIKNQLFKWAPNFFKVGRELILSARGQLPPTHPP